MPATEAAWLDGDIGEAHVEPLTAVRRRVGPDRFDADEAQLVGHAKALPFREFGRLLTYWTQAADPDGAERDARAQRDARRLHFSQSFEGMWFAEGFFDPVSGGIVTRALSRSRTSCSRQAQARQAPATMRRRALGGARRSNVGRMRS